MSMNPDVTSGSEAAAHKTAVLNNLRNNAALGENVDAGVFFADTLEAEKVGLTEDPKFSQFLQVAGEDPVIREALYFRLKRDISLQESEDIQQDLHLASLYGMDQEPEKPNYEPFYKFIIQTQKEYGPITETEKDEALDFIKQGEGASSLEEYEELYHAIKDKVVSWPDEYLAQLPPYLLAELIGWGHLKPSRIINLSKDQDAVDKNKELSFGYSSDEERDGFVKEQIRDWRLDKEEIPKMAVAALKEAYQIAGTNIADFNPDKPISAGDLVAAIWSAHRVDLNSIDVLVKESSLLDGTPFLGSKRRSDRQTKIVELKRAADELLKARALLVIAASESKIYEKLITPPGPEQEGLSPEDKSDRILAEEKSVENLFDELRQEGEATNEASSYRRYFLLFPSSKALQTMTELANILGLPEDARTSTITEMADNYSFLIKRSIFNGMKKIFATQPELVERLFSQASPEIQQAWRQFKNVLLNAEPEFSTRSAKLFTDLSGLVDKEAGISDEDMQQSDKLSKYVFEKRRDFRENLLKKEPHVSTEDLIAAFVAFNQAQVAESREKIRLQQVRNSFMDDLARKAGLKSQEQSGFDYPKLVVVESQ